MQHNGKIRVKLVNQKQEYGKNGISKKEMVPKKGLEPLRP